MIGKPGLSLAQTWAVALVRWCLGLMLLLYGLHKLPNLGPFAQNYIITPLGKTGLPPALLAVLGVGLPYLEIALGVLLVLGWARNIVLIVTGIYLVLLTLGEVMFTLGFGQWMLMQPPMVFQCFMYLVVTAALLFLEEYDTWALGRRRKQPLAHTGNARPLSPVDRPPTAQAAASGSSMDTSRDSSQRSRETPC